MTQIKKKMSSLPALMTTIQATRMLTHQKQNPLKKQSRN